MLPILVREFSNIVLQLVLHPHLDACDGLVGGDVVVLPDEGEHPLEIFGLENLLQIEHYFLCLREGVAPNRLTV